MEAGQEATHIAALEAKVSRIESERNDAQAQAAKLAESLRRVNAARTTNTGEGLQEIVNRALYAIDLPDLEVAIENTDDDEFVITVTGATINDDDRIVAPVKVYEVCGTVTMEVSFRVEAIDDDTANDYGTQILDHIQDELSGTYVSIGSQEGVGDDDDVSLSNHGYEVTRVLIY